MDVCSKILWYGLRIFYAVGIVFLISILIALLLSFVPVNTSFAKGQQETIEIFITSNGIHTDFVLPVETKVINWREKLPLSQFRGVTNNYESISFGWGDRKFYMETPEWSDLTLKVALSAVFWPTPTAMHVQYIPNTLQPSKRKRPVHLTLAQYSKLVIYIQDSFQTDSSGFILIPGAGYTPLDNFYEGKGKFFFPKNCNNWVNAGLKAAGVKTAFWAPFPFSIMRHLK
jgi:uncharacterized protein (TIGR02117 family)